jgi:type II secretory pathway component GspD/PulD (secretin)
MRSRRPRPRVLRLSTIIAFAAAMASAAPASAQAPPGVRTTAQGVLLDFQDADIRIVLSALAEAGGLNVVHADLPPIRVTLRTNQPVERAQIPGILRSIAEGNGLVVSEDGPLIRVVSATRGQADGRAPGAAEPDAAVEMRLFVYRLKHSSADRLSATLQSVFGAGPAARAAAGPIRAPLSQQLSEQRIPPVAPDDAVAVAVEIRDALPSLPGQLSSAVQIVPDELTNSILVRAQTDDWEIIRQAIEMLDLRPLQVLIEGMIVEVRHTHDFQLGVSAFGSERPGRSGDRQVRGEFFTPDGDGLLVQILQAGGLDLDVTLTALAARGQVRVLSRPVLLAQNNQEARILVGAQRPFIQVFRTLPTEGAVRDQVIQYRDVGTSLTIRPTINLDGYVNLNVMQEISTATAETQFGAPVISTREASTQLFVRDGQTVVIGGLTEEQRSRQRSGIPLLRDIPVLGVFFGATHDATSQSELFLFLTPHIVATDEDADRIRREIEAASPMLRRDPPNGGHR